jgi:Zn-dependent metalloprotease
MTNTHQPYGKCGYATSGKLHFQKMSQGFSSLSSNIKKITPKNTINGTPIKQCNVTDFTPTSVELSSKNNPPTMSTLITVDEVGTKHAISNIVFAQDGKQKTIQFMCVNGKNLSKYEYNNPGQVVDMVNSGKLPVVSIKKNMENASSVITSYMDIYSSNIWYNMFFYDLFNRVGFVEDNTQQSPFVLDNPSPIVFLSVVNVDVPTTFWNGFYMTHGRNVPNDLGLDVLGHEMSHGLIEACSGLKYQGETNMIIESMSDIIGICFKKYYDLRSENQVFDWSMNNNINRYFDFISNPKSRGLPDTYKGKDTENASINNYLFYLMCKKIPVFKVF